VKREETALLAEIASLARSLPRPVLLGLCDALESLPASAPPAERAAIVQTVAHPAMREALSRLLNTWRDRAPAVPPTTVAWSLRAASEADEYRRSYQSVELVWTGPSATATTLRRTDQALLDLIQAARRSLLLVAFTAHKIPEITTALAHSADRGVAITFIAESPETSPGRSSLAAIQALDTALAGRLAVYTWPLHQRPRDPSGRHGSLHVKCAVADDTALLISSANLTDYALNLNLNMELGLLIRRGDLPTQVAHHFRQLIHNGILTPVRY
jgi:phosphatidylserine/phosphatidylglycerophosphate/cardiolipin synthase-like enzyme